MSISNTLKVLKDLLVLTDVDKRFCELSRKKWSKVNNTDGDGNTAFGYRAGAYTQTGENNVFLGKNIA